MPEQMKYTNHIAHYKTDAELNDYFTVDKFEEQNIRRRYQALLKFYNIKDTDRVLEIGSGGGPALSVFKDKKFSYFPVDIPFENLNRIKNLEQMSQEQPENTLSSMGVYLAAADVYHLPFRGPSFNCIIMSEVLEHLDEAQTALMEINRVLKQDGVLLLSVPYKERISKALCVHCNRLTPFNAHFQSFDENKLQESLSRAGLKTHSWFVMNNKIADRLHFNLITKKLPFGLWRFFDRLLNLIIKNKATHLLLKAGK